MKQVTLPVGLNAVLIACIIGGGVVGAMAYTKTGPFAQYAEMDAVRDRTQSSGTSEGSEAGAGDEESSSVAASTDDAASTGETEPSQTTTDTGQDHSKGTNSASTSDDYYVLPESSTRVYSASELAGLSDWDLKVARNEIFARYGRGFSDTALQDYFNSKSWYTRKYSPEEFDSMTSPLNDTERANIDVIKSLEPASNFS